MVEKKAKRGGPKGLRWTAGTLWTLAGEVNEGKVKQADAVKKFAKAVDPEEFKVVVQDQKNLGQEAFMAKYEKKRKVRAKAKKLDLTSLPEAIKEALFDLRATEQTLTAQLAEVQGTIRRYEGTLKSLTVS